MLKKIALLSIPLLVAAVITANAQNDNVIINRNIKSLEKQASDMPVEKVHLHLDRQLYFPSDTIWFKAYTVLGEYHRLSGLSGILYAELIGTKDTVLQRLTLRMDVGVCAGEFALPYNAAPGTYRIRAYTNWMRNAGPEYFYDQPVTIAAFSSAIDSVKAKSAGVLGKSEGHDKVDLQFFPEGGNLVNGLRSKVAFKAVNQNGLSEEVQGSVTDMEGNEVATFTTQHLGMGLFPLAPQKGKRYQAKVTAADGSAFTVPLPMAKDTGLTLSVNNNLADSLYVKIAANSELYKSGRDTAVYLVAQSGGKYYFAAGRKLADEVFTAAIPRSRFPSGIVQFTLFSQSGEPLNERVVFIQNPDQLNLTLTTNNTVSGPGENMKFKLEAKNPGGNVAIGTFSVSVVDETRVPINESAESTIFTDLLLRSELTGHIEEPNYYFMEPGDQTRADLDLLMLTQGYRRFEWKKMLSGNPHVIAYQPEKGFTLSGAVNTQGGKPVPKGKVFLSSTKNLFVVDTLTDENGKFAFNNIILPDTAKIIVNAKKANGGNNVVLTIDKPAYPPIEKNNQVNGYILNHYSTKQVQLAYTSWKQDSLGHVILLKEVNIKDHKTKPFHPDYAVLLKHSPNLNGPGRADQVIMGDELVGCPNIIDCIISKARGGVRFSYSGSTPVAYSTHTPIEITGPTKPMAVLLNGVITGQDALTMISAIDIQSIELLESPIYSSIYGSAATGGLIVITTKYGDEVNATVTIQPGLSLFKFHGFYKAREFYSPKYDSKNAVSRADQRKTVYWNPGISTDAKGRTSFEYFNAGTAGNYRVVIEGIDGDGKLGRQVFRYKVE